MREIERKFLVTTLPDYVKSCEYSNITQWYITKPTDSIENRFRCYTTDDGSILKSYFDIKIGTGMIREEIGQKVDYKNIQYGFIDACRKNQKDVVDFLLKLNNNQKIDQKTIQTGFRKACIFSNLEILECLIKLKKDQEVLQDTIRYNLSYTYKRDKVISLLLNINEYRKNQ